MPKLVENAGEPFFAGWLSRVCGLTGKRGGVRKVCGRLVSWELSKQAEFTVVHPPADVSAAPVSYLISLLVTKLPFGGARWWWSCPECARRVDVLYFTADRDKLACRRCCGLHYRSQYDRRRLPRRKHRPIVRPEPVIFRWGGSQRQW